jgi:hypothetical protein
MPTRKPRAKTELLVKSPSAEQIKADLAQAAAWRKKHKKKKGAPGYADNALAQNVRYQMPIRK